MAAAAEYPVALHEVDILCRNMPPIESSFLLPSLFTYAKQQHQQQRRDAHNIPTKLLR